MSSSQGQATWRSMRASGGYASSSHQAQAQAQAQAPVPAQPPPSNSATVTGPFPPGYPNAPPVQLPPGINQQQWNQGYWRFDPKPGWTSASAQAAPGQMVYNNQGLVNKPQVRSQSQPPPHTTWVPHPHWQFPPDFNPYKRVPKPPDPSYWATELSDNPLGLENMHITRKFIEDHDGHTTQTPWVWTSASLPGEEGSPSEAPGVRGQRGPQSQYPLVSASEQIEHRRSRDIHSSANKRDEVSVRQSVHTPESQTNGRAHPHHPPQASPTQPQDISPPKASVTPQRRSSLYRRHTYDNNAPHVHSPSSGSSSSPSKPEHDTRAKYVEDDGRKQERRRPSEIIVDDQGDNKDLDAEEAFSGRKELHPTFSPAIVRTPKYYTERANTPTSTPTRPSSSSTLTRPASSTMTKYPLSSSSAPPLVSHLLETKSDVLSPLIGATPRPSSTSILGERTHSEPPSTMGQPVSTASSHSQQHVQQQHLRSVSRSRTYPTLDPVSEDPFSSTPRDVQSARSLFSTTSATKAEKVTKNRSISRSHTSPDPVQMVQSSRAVPRSHTSPDPAQTVQSSRAVSPQRNTTPSRPSSRPTPPSRPTSRTPSRAHSRSPSNNISNLPPPVPPDLLAKMQEKYPNSVLTQISVRKGYWNRRGDHYTDGYIVYAPPNKANPPELARYPSPRTGFMNFDGASIPFNPHMPELPESLPRFGQDPVKPYDSFVQYDRRWHPVDPPITPP